MIPIEFKNTSDHEWSLNTTIWPRAIANTYMEATDPVFVASAYYGNRGIFAGGTSPAPAKIDTIEYYTSIGTSAESVDFGNLTAATADAGAASAGARAVVFGGESPTAKVDIIEYITVASTGEATDFGNLTSARASVCSNLSDGSRGVFAGGVDPTTTPIRDNTIDYITISVTGNAINFGDTVAGHSDSTGVSNGSRGVVAGGYGGAPGTAYSNILSYITIGTVGTSIDFGDLHYGSSGAGSVSDGSRGVYGGGGVPANVDTISYFNIASFGNGADFGELTQARRGNHGGASNGSRGLIQAGGYVSAGVDTIEYVTIGVLGNATDWNELLAARHGVASTSGD